jgi:hypothetical protein
MYKKFLVALLLFTAHNLTVNAQNGEVRGFVYDKESGEPIIYTPVYILQTMSGASTDINGFYAISKVRPGNYTLRCYALGYDSIKLNITIQEGRITNQNIYLPRVSRQLKEVEIKGEKQKNRTEVKVSNITITQKELKQLPSFGGEPDLAQYLQILPGAVFSGDQGGQLYLRGGPPVQNKVMLDGMTIYNPFHSIGLFSVFDADIIRTADVFAGGFNTQYGGRIGSIIDVSTREGNKKRLSGKVSVNPITAKALIEGPIDKFTEGGGSSSFIFSIKNSYLNRTSQTLYPYADPENRTNGLPYSFNDVYAKYSYIGSGGSKVNLFGFRFDDATDLPQTQYRWSNYGFGSNFFIVPEGSTIINGAASYSQYDMEQLESDRRPRESGIGGFNIALNFTNFLGKDDIRYGFEVNGFKTVFKYFNTYGLGLSQEENTTELCGFVKYKKVAGRFVIEPGIRIQNYASLSNYSFEPRIGMKWNTTDWMRVKASAGMYSQNLVNAVSDQDVINLFYGFLSGPEDDLQNTFEGRNVSHRMQTAIHYIGGLEFDVGLHGEINVEAFYKDFTQLTNINRDKKFDNTAANQNKPERERVSYIIETGNAYGADIRYKYEYKNYYLWAVYSLTYVNRYDGVRNYFPHFDRRHNFNLVATYTFGNQGSWSFNTRWNFGSGFPFTQTQGFYEQLNFSGGVGTGFLNQNGTLTPYFTDINSGRLPYFHRLDMSLSKKIKFSETRSLTITVAATNVYNRPNIFYFDRANYRRVDQLPIMPTLGINYSF